MIECFIQGECRPQGSKQGFIRGGRVVLVDGGGSGAQKLKTWRASVKSALENFEPISGPIEIYLDFRLLRPKSRLRLKESYVSVKPDLDKLTRAVFDGITDSGAWEDDSRVVSLHATKTYVDDLELAGVSLRFYSV